MSDGYVLDFSNRTFQEFILESTGIDIYDIKYAYASGSKANRLRAFLDQEPNNIVGKLIVNLLEYWKAQKLISSTQIIQVEEDLFDECSKISEKLIQDVISEDPPTSFANAKP
ncbi:hypothetical protein GTQ43_14585 [Nostoc sp. KVJ3]|uniref:hypothetical protein n=1 Tax=Nostoc sp. KVJ3 TaxID=457945 RepID=UPI0022385BCE|nr:hypothetical protein [Nostoc sp. KVJ3]MCW5314990.1 hypothetical protein [Nostoc sp. KVJ3]